MFNGVLQNIYKLFVLNNRMWIRKFGSYYKKVLSILIKWYWNIWSTHFSVMATTAKWWLSLLKRRLLLLSACADLVGGLLRWCSDHGCCYAADLGGSLVLWRRLLLVLLLIWLAASCAGDRYVCSVRKYHHRSCTTVTSTYKYYKSITT